jgi:hypothetical protein
LAGAIGARRGESNRRRHAQGAALSGRRPCPFDDDQDAPWQWAQVFKNRRGVQSVARLFPRSEFHRGSVRRREKNGDRLKEAARFSDMAAKKSSKAMKTTRARKTSKRTVLEPKKGDRRYVRRNKKGEFKKEVSVGRSLAADRKRTAKTKVKKGQGDRGDVAK